MASINTRKKLTVQTEDIRKISDEIGNIYFTRLMALSDVVNRYVGIALKNEVNWLRLRTLITLARRGKGAITPSELAKHLLRSNQNMTKIVDDLEKDGLVIKNRESGDRRVLTIKITGMGIDYIRECLHKIAFADRELRYCVTDDDLETIARVLIEFRNHLVGLLSKDRNHLLKSYVLESSVRNGKRKIERGHQKK
ncbi:MAG TPA: MarR family transcriptional regulator [Syntrophorhabdaceae bacterium]|nr:MarR family transcriptional regulator [Syntrophorhabdaceae bacterium]